MLKIRIGYEQTVVVQNYQNLILTAAAIFGKKKTNGVPEGVMVPKNETELIAALAMVTGKGG